MVGKNLLTTTKSIVLCLLLAFAGPAWCVDTDQDGLSDSDEALLGTDPQNPDTDGDAIIDGWEVQLGDDPLSPRYSLVSNSWNYLNVDYFSPEPAQLSKIMTIIFVSQMTTRQTARAGPL